MASAGKGNLGSNSGERAWETATISKEGNRHANNLILTGGVVTMNNDTEDF